MSACPGTGEPVRVPNTPPGSARCPRCGGHPGTYHPLDGGTVLFIGHARRATRSTEPVRLTR